MAWDGTLVDVEAAVERLAARQSGLITRRQALDAGLTEEMIRARLRSGRWSHVHSDRGVYATFSGPLPRPAQLWGVVLSCGPGATLSHETAAELHGLIDRPSRLIHVTVPVGRRVTSPARTILHRSARLSDSRHPVQEPPRTRVEDTVVDLTQTAWSRDRASGIIADAVNRRLTTHERVYQAIRSRKRVRWRAELTESCGIIADGARSLLEVRYVTDVERPHGLPKARRQVRRKVDGHGIAIDARLDAYGVRIELDGQRAHTGDEVFRDAQRDNLAVLEGDAPLRFGWDDVTDYPCETAALIANVLKIRGWRGWPTLCSLSCPL
jgi:hypothetical protein